MKPARKRRLLIVGFILLGIGGAAGLLFAALGNNMNHYYELAAIESDEAPIGKTIRIGGMVEAGSIKRTDGSLAVTFAVTDFTRRLSVNYEGILPDLFREGQGVLAKGKLLDKNTFVAEEILAKHDENYMPKEVREELEKSGYYKHTEGKSTENKPNVVE